MKIYYDNELDYDHQILSYDQKEYDQYKVSEILLSILMDMYDDPKELQKWLVSMLYGITCRNELEKMEEQDD